MELMHCIKKVYMKLEKSGELGDSMDFPRETLKIKHYDWFDFVQNKRYL